MAVHTTIKATVKTSCLSTCPIMLMGTWSQALKASTPTVE